MTAKAHIPITQTTNLKIILSMKKPLCESLKLEVPTRVVDSLTRAVVS